ncbi:unnamed protein product [Rhizophagus irregularis]|nr:unnamed protein product [Rhizophagus irregularis]
MDKAIQGNNLKWFPYDKFKNVEYLNKGGFGTIYKAIFSTDKGNEEVILKCHNNLNDNLNEFLNGWKHPFYNEYGNLIDLYGFTKNPVTSKYMVVMDYANKGERPEIIENTPQCYVDLMKKCWDEDPFKRPSSEEVSDIIRKWTYLPYKMNIEDINEELKCNVMEFINAPIGHNNFVTESHSQACYTSRLLDFTSKKLNEILESEDSQVINV